MDNFDPVAYINEPRWQQVRPGLERIDELLRRMGQPQDRLRFVHVAGTNGKGSTCAYLADILQAAGYRTGLFTSPYIIEFEERIRVDGVNVDRDSLRDVTLFVRKHAEAMVEAGFEHPTEFELMCAVAFEHFARSACDIVVCEVGLGGRLDSTNIIAAPEACVIARIGLDHTDFLGDTLAEVAGEKAGIIKQGSPVVVYPQDSPEAQEVIGARAEACGCSLTIPDFSKLSIGGVDETGMRTFAYDGLAYSTRLLGSYQPFNAVMAIETARVLRMRGWEIDDEALVRGIRNTSWPGRFEIVEAQGDCAAVVVDGGHNPQGAEVLAESLADVFADKRIVFLMSVLADKDYRAMIRPVAPLGAAWVCVTSPNVGRALAGADLAAAVREEVARPGVPVETAPDFACGLARAKQLAGAHGVVCAWGSLYSLAELKDAIAQPREGA